MAPTNPSPRAETHEHHNFMERTFAEHQAPLTRYATKLLGDADRARDVVPDARKLRQFPPGPKEGSQSNGRSAAQTVSARMRCPSAVGWIMSG